MFLCILHVGGALFLLGFQFGQRMICYMFCIVIYKFHWHSFWFVAIYCVFDCTWCCMFEMLGIVLHESATT